MKFTDERRANIRAAVNTPEARAKRTASRAAFYARNGDTLSATQVAELLAYYATHTAAETAAQWLVSAGYVWTLASRHRVRKPRGPRPGTPRKRTG